MSKFHSENENNTLIDREARSKKSLTAQTPIKILSANHGAPETVHIDQINSIVLYLIVCSHLGRMSKSS